MTIYVMPIYNIFEELYSKSMMSAMVKSKHKKYP